MFYDRTKKEVIYCPDCKHRMRIPKYKKIRFTCSKCKKSILYDGRPNNKPYYIAAAIFVVLISYFSFFGDYFRYLYVKSKRTETACIDYYSAYPKGYFTEDVKFIEIEVVKDIQLVREFLKSYPKSEKRFDVIKLNESLWNFEISRYNEIVKERTNLDPKAVSFFRNLLTYMRDNNETTIVLDLIGNVDVKDFDEYEPNIITKLDAMMKRTDKRTVSDHIIAMKTNYDQGQLRQYENIISESIEASFENILSKNFITVTSDSYSKSYLHITIQYHIKNQENRFDNSGLAFPTIWTYTKGESAEGFISYLIGVSIGYDFEIKLPGSTENFSFEHRTNALDDIANVRSIEEGYRRMTAQNFNNYANIISTKFGLIATE